MVLALGLLMIGIAARFMTHAPNFTPVLAIALFGGVYLRRSQAVYIPLLLMIVSDLFIGLHPTIPFTWSSIVLTSLIGVWIRQNPAPLKILGGAALSAVLFFIITNFGAWLTLYPLTREGFVTCYSLAIPFFRMTFVSTLMYTAVLFITYELVSRRIKGTRLAPVLLNQ